MKNKNILIILGVFVGLLVVFVLLEMSNIINLYNKEPRVNTKGPTAEQKLQDSKINADAKQQLIEEKVPDNNSIPTNDVAGKTIELSAKQETNNTVTVFTKLHGYSDGSCQLTVTNGPQANSQTAPIMYQPEFSSCAGFSVPIDSVGKGSWSIKLTATSKGTTDTKTISFEVK